MDRNNKLEAADYLEPECVLKEKPLGYGRKIERIPQQRVAYKLDELMARKDFSAAERLLKYWLGEAEKNDDEQGVFMLLNELMGYYRKTGRKYEAYEAAERALDMAGPLGYDSSVSGATCYVNAATVYTAFNEFERSIELFEKARVIYEANRTNNEYKLAGLYNNMAIALTGAGKYLSAVEMYEKALDAAGNVENAELEQAMTYLNLLDCLISEKGAGIEIEQQAAEYLEKAREMLDTETLIRDSYYSYVCDKCVSVYDHFGWFAYAKELRERIRAIDEGA